MTKAPAILVGILTDVFPVEIKQNFTKRVFWLKEPGTERYPQHWEIELHGSDVDQIMKVKIGDSLEVEVEPRGRQWTGRNNEKKIFTSLKCTGLKLVTELKTTGGYKQGQHDDKVDKNRQGQLPM